MRSAERAMVTVGLAKDVEALNLLLGWPIARPKLKFARCRSPWPQHHASPGSGLVALDTELVEERLKPSPPAWFHLPGD